MSPLVTAAGLVLPIALVWLGVSLARQLAELRAEADDLRRTLRAMRGMPAEDRDVAPAPPRQAPTPGPTRSGHAQAAPPARTPASPPLAAQPVTPKPRGAAEQRPADARQAALRFEAAGAGSVDAGLLIRALNFPDGPDDHEAIDALRQALKDPTHSRVLRAAQDVVTLLAGRDVYMDDLPPEPARPDVWRRFAQGERGSAVAALGGIHSADALEIAAAMLQEDEIFRDTAHHFLRHFDGMAGRVVPQLDDLQISVLADSRSARAFMLLGRVSGVFG